MPLKSFIEHDTPASVEDLKTLAKESGYFDTINLNISWEIPKYFKKNVDYIFNIITLKNKNITGHYCTIHNQIYFDCFGLPPPIEFQIQHPEIKYYYPNQLMSVNDSECWLDCLLFIKDYKGKGYLISDAKPLTKKQQEIKKIYEERFNFNFK